MTDNDRIGRLLSIDPLLEAEKITGSDYKDDKATMGLGFLLMQQTAMAKEAALSASHDTYYGITYDEAFCVARDLGFEHLNSWGFKDYRDYEDGREVWNTYSLLWQPEKGVLLEIEGYDGDSRVNSMKIYFNLELAGGFNYPSNLRYSGHYWSDDWDAEDRRRVLVGDVDVREGLRYNMGLLDKYGTPLNDWVECPIFALTNYAETYFPGNFYTNPDYPDHRAWMDKYDLLTTQKIQTLPDDIQARIKWVTHAEQDRIRNNKEK